MFVRNTWYQAGWSDEVAAGQPLARTLLDTPILFMRSEAGTLSAIVDRCPHRFAPLSAGQVLDDRVVCGYHGLAFDGFGKCVHNPHGPITSAMRVPAFPLAERYGAIWIWMGDQHAADPSLLPDLSFIEETPAAGRVNGYLPTRANYQLVCDNIMDLTHADYLHPTTLGGMVTDSKVKTSQDGDAVCIEWLAEDIVPPHTFKMFVPPESRADIWTQVVWHAPAIMVLKTATTVPGVAPTIEGTAVTLHSVAPETATSSHYFYCATRRFALDEEFSGYLKIILDQAFVGEDKPMLEKQQASMVTSDLFSLKPILLNIDAGAVRARRVIERRLSEEEQSHAPSSAGSVALEPV